MYLLADGKEILKKTVSAADNWQWTWEGLPKYDEQNRVYILYPLRKLEEDIGFSRHTVIDCMKELEDIGLILHKKTNKEARQCVKKRQFI